MSIKYAYGSWPLSLADWTKIQPRALPHAGTLQIATPFCPEPLGEIVSHAILTTAKCPSLTYRFTPIDVSSKEKKAVTFAKNLKCLLGVNYFDRRIDSA